MTQKKKVHAISKKENKILVSRPIIFHVVLQIEGIYGNGDEIMNWIQMACEKFQNFAF
jgi:hypothetical protein